MNRFLLICAALVAALTFWTPAPASAGEQDKSIYGNWPAEMHRENPFADDLGQARKRLDQTIARFWDVYARDPWNYWVVVDAYYDYADAYQRYVWTLWRYWHWENTHYRFSGRVLTRDVELFRPFDANAPEAKDEALRVARPEQPVPGATITLQRNVMFLAGQPLAQMEEAKQAAAVGQSIVAPGPRAGFRTQADERGRFDFRGVPRGQYRFTVTAPGYFPQAGLVEIAATRQERDVYLTRHRRFEGVVFTVTRDCLPILRPLLARAGTAGGAVADVASADEVEKILGSDQRILPQYRRLIPVEGARVTLHANVNVQFAVPGERIHAEPGLRPGPSLAPLAVPGQAPGQLPPVPGQVPGQLPPVPGQVPGQLPPVPGQVPPLPGSDEKARPTSWLPEPMTTTGADGRFQFLDLGQTSYRVSVEKHGFLPFNARINLERAHTRRRIVIFPFVPFEPVVADPMQTQQIDLQGKSLNDPFAK